MFTLGLCAAAMWLTYFVGGRWAHWWHYDAAVFWYVLFLQNGLFLAADVLVHNWWAIPIMATLVALSGHGLHQELRREVRQ